MPPRRRGWSRRKKEQACSREMKQGLIPLTIAIEFQRRARFVALPRASSSMAVVNYGGGIQRERGESVNHRGLQARNASLEKEVGIIAGRRGQKGENRNFPYLSSCARAEARAQVRFELAGQSGAYTFVRNGNAYGQQKRANWPSGQEREAVSPLPFFSIERANAVCHQFKAPFQGWQEKISF